MTPQEHFCIQMSNGRYFYYDRPDEAEYTIWVVAHALSQITRFHGHCSTPYSVAQHSVHVCDALPREHALSGLLHDGGEAFMQDLAAPLKYWLQQKCPEYAKLNSVVHESVRRKFGAPAKVPEAVKLMDLRVLAMERKAFMTLSRNWEDQELPEQWTILQDVEPLPEPRDFSHEEAWEPRVAARMFVSRYFDLTIKDSEKKRQMIQKAQHAPYRRY